MTLEFISEDHASIPVLLCNSDTVKEVVARLAAPAQRWIAQQGFTGGFGEAVLCPTASGEAELAILGLGDTQSRARKLRSLDRALMPQERPLAKSGARARV